MKTIRNTSSDVAGYRPFAIRCFSRFGRLTPEEELALHQAASSVETHPAATAIIEEGSVLSRPRFLLSGWAARVRVLSDGRRQIFTFLVPGDVFGIGTDIRKSAPCDIVTLTRVAVAPLSALEHSPEDSAFAHAAAQAILQDEVRLLDQVVRTGRLMAHERVVHLLLELHERLNTVGLAANGRFNLPLTQDVLSDALGLSVVHTNRTLQRLKRDGLIEVRGTEVTLAAPDILARMSESGVGTRERRPPAAESKDLHTEMP